jgi:hypothetical protein
MPQPDELERYERTEAQDIIHLIEAARPSQEIPTPANFRANVLAKVEQRRSRQGVLTWITAVLTPTWAPALAAALLLSLGFNAWLGFRILDQPETGGQQVAGTLQGVHGPLNAYVFQAGLSREADLGALVTKQAAIERQVVAFGFAAKPAPAKSFLIGALYIEALAYVRSGDLQAAAQRWATIDKELVSVAEPLATHIHTVQRLLESQNPAPETVGASLALFEPFYEAYVQDTDTAQLTLFQMGAWLGNMSLAAAANDKAALRHIDTIEYFSHEMQRLHAPTGVLDALDRLRAMLGQADITDRDVNGVLKLVQKMQRMLG